MHQRSVFFILPCLIFLLYALFPHISHAFTLTRPPNNLGLVGYWSFDSSTVEGSVVHDLSGQGNHGSRYGDTGGEITGYTVSGAGNPDYDGAYEKIGTHTEYGDYYSNGTMYLYFTNGESPVGCVWVLTYESDIEEAVVNVDPAYCVDGEESDFADEGDWYESGEVGPAPTVERVSEPTSDWLIPGKIRQAGAFDGGSYINISSFSNPIYTVSIWFKLEEVITSSSNPISLLRFNTFSEGDHIDLGNGTSYCTNEIIAISVGVEKRTCVPSSSLPYIDTDWNHLVISWIGDRYDIYLNGEKLSGLQTGPSGHALFISSSFLNISSEYNTSPLLIDDLRIYSRALSPDEISRLYESGNRTATATILPNDPTKHTTINTSQNNRLTDGLVGLWSFNGPDISGSTAYDRSGNENHGTIYGATPTIGKVGQGVGFDGSDDHVDLNTTAGEGLESFTLSAWVKKDAAERAYLLARTSNSGGIGFEVYPDTIYLNTGKTGWGYTSYTIDGEWVHLVMVLSPNSLTFYLNGVEQSVTIGAGALSGAINSFWTSWHVGYRPWSPHYAKSQFDEVRMYNRALSAGEVLQLYKLGM